MKTGTVQLILGAIALLSCMLPTPALRAQDAPPEGIRLRAPYNVQRPLLAVRPLIAEPGMQATADSITRIIQRDLEWDGRFAVLQPVPQALRAGDIDYSAWNATGAVYLVAGEVAAGADGPVLSLSVHDVVYGRPLARRALALPPLGDAGFRMNVHAVADAVVAWTLQQPGRAASRVSVIRRNSESSYEILVVDSDGFGVRRLVGGSDRLYSPVWSPDGTRMMHVAADDVAATWTLVERHLTSGEARAMRLGGEMLSTPAYGPNGAAAIAVWQGAGQQVMGFDLARGCCTRTLSGSSDFMEAYPSFSGDGARMAFVSDRLQRDRPHVFTMPAAGGAVTLLTPHVPGQRHYYTSPAWSPTSSAIAFHGHWNSSGQYQLMLADGDRPGAAVVQLTALGHNEEPSWSPDGRQLVYTSTGDGETGVWIMDVESGSRRLLVAGHGLRTPKWSPLLMRLDR